MDSTGNDSASTGGASSTTVRIPSRFNGPPGSANGGYASGVLGELLGGVAEVNLRSPPPLDVDLQVREVDGALHAFHGETLVAEVRPGVVALDLPEPVSHARAVQAAQGYPAHEGHPYPGCFVCGPARDPGDGLRVFPGAVEGRAVVAAPWTPDDTVCIDGTLDRACLWAVLDCPSYFGIYARTGTLPVALLARLTARIEGVPVQGEDCTVMGWCTRVDGRKAEVGSAVFSGENLLALASGLWVLQKP